jgi:glycosyltransferase involved in cell wall biosynthesis
MGPRLRDQARQSGVADRIFWPGWQTDPGPYFQLADLVVFPSLDAETLGNVILEAWAWRKPLVTTSFRGAREIARHGEDAWCVPCGDGAALAQGIEALLRDPGLTAAITERGGERARLEFGRERILDQYLGLYRDLARRPG